MARFAVGDLQGCLDPLLRLLERARFEPGHDELWLVGDLVNRGPQSLAALRFVRELGGSARTVLGNHDLHLLAVAHGARLPARGDTLQAILDAPDATDLLEWLAAQPLLLRDPEQRMTLVHAGIAPQWCAEEAEALAAEVSAALAGPSRTDFLGAMYGNEPDCWNAGLEGFERLRVITNYLTRMRFCSPEGRLNLRAKDAPENPPPGCVPWFRAPDARWRGETVVFGHWAALNGRVSDPDLIALDTGCVWGNCMTLINLDTRERLQHPCS